MVKQSSFCCLILCLYLSACSSGASNSPNPVPATAKFANLSTISSIEIGSQAYASAVDGTKLLYTDEETGFGTVDTVKPLSLSLSPSRIPSAFLSSFDTMYNIVVAGNVAVLSVNPACIGYCRGDGREIRLYDITDTNQPQHLSTLSIAADHILNDGTTLYITGGSIGDTNNFYVVDIMDPSAPTVLSTTPISDPGYLAKKDNIVYVSRIREMDSGDKYLNIINIDVSDKSRPIVENSASGIAFNQTYSPIAVAGHILYYLDMNGLNVVDITDRSAPNLIRTISLQKGTPRSLAVYSNKLYVAAGSSGVMVFDITEPENAIYLKSMKSSTDAISVSVSGGVGAYLTEPLKQQTRWGWNMLSGYKLNLFFDNAPVPHIKVQSPPLISVLSSFHPET